MISARRPSIKGTQPLFIVIKAIIFIIINIWYIKHNDRKLLFNLEAKYIKHKYFKRCILAVPCDHDSCRAAIVKRNNNASKVTLIKSRAEEV